MVKKQSPKGHEIFADEVAAGGCWNIGRNNGSSIFLLEALLTLSYSLFNLTVGLPTSVRWDSSQGSGEL